MESSGRLVPYSLYLSQETYTALKEKAKSRQASKVVRDAITMILEGTDQFTSGYRKGVRDAMDIVHKDELAGTVAVHDKRIADHLIDQMEGLIDEA